MDLTKVLVLEYSTESMIKIYKNCYKKATTIFRFSFPSESRITQLPRLGIIC